VCGRLRCEEGGSISLRGISRFRAGDVSEKISAQDPEVDGAFALQSNGHGEDDKFSIQKHQNGVLFSEGFYLWFDLL
jgi:hypothetical protein